MTFDVIVCGSGPAGLSAAVAAGESGKSVLLVEKQNVFGGKYPVSGNGKCNFSNTLDPVPFMNAFGRAGRFMTQALACGGKEWFCQFLTDHGVPVNTPDGFHYFPVSERSADVQDVFFRVLREQNCAFRTSLAVKEILLSDGKVSGVSFSDGTSAECRALILACGGTAMSAVGGTGSGLRLAEQVGHRIVESLPAMAPLYLAENPFYALSGVSLKQATLRFTCRSVTEVWSGELLFTHDGLSGPAALSISGPVYRAWHTSPEKCNLTLSFDHTIDWRNTIDRFRKEESNKLFRSSLAEYLPRSLAHFLAAYAGMDERRNQTIKDVEREDLVRMLTAFPLTIGALCPMTRAMAMSGGVTWKEVRPETMESRLVPGLYFAGEILDLTGPCGGYNIQFAVASGRLAGLSSTRS